MSVIAEEFDASRIKTPKQAYRDATCPLYTAAKILGKRWTLNLLQDLFAGGGSRRFNELRRSLDWIAPKVLSQRLKELKKFGIIDRKVNTESSPVRVTYSLTEKGWGLEPVLGCLKEWGMKFIKQEITHCADVICMSCEPPSKDAD
ncbi:MAG: winged helix-turn-helix transcriptional regulator [Candidatus Heimdallarchaeota archaeon]